MKWYIASRVRHKERLIQIADILKSEGEVVTSDWIYHDFVKPYEKNLVTVQNFAEDVVKGITDSDIFILISDPEGTDMFIELGIALSAGVRKLYIVGQHSKRSLMQLHPNITHVEKIQDILNKEGIGCRIPELKLS
jgi:hypothetical protein